MKSLALTYLCVVNLKYYVYSVYFNFIVTNRLVGYNKYIKQ